MERKFPHLILTAYLAVAVMGIFSFSALEPLREIDFWTDKPVSSGFLSPVDISIDCLAESTALMSRARGYSFSPLRNGSLRIFIPFGGKNFNPLLSYTLLSPIEKMNSLGTMYTIPLKLRI